MLDPEAIGTDNIGVLKLPVRPCLLAVLVCLMTHPVPLYARRGADSSPQDTPIHDRQAEHESPPPEEARVTIRGGQTLIGLLIEDDDRGIRLRVDGRDVVIPAAEITVVEQLPPIEERYRIRKAQIRPNDIEARLLLAKWLRERERYTLALIEAEGVVGAAPGNARARDLVRWLRAQLVLQNRTRQRQLDADPGADRDPPRPAQTGNDERPKFPRLTPEQINLIRVYETDLSDPPKMVIPRPVIERLIEGYRDHPLIPRDEEGIRLLLTARPAKVLDLMFRVQARELYGEVRVLEDPGVMETFRKEVHGRWLATACATSTCHGGQEAGRLMLAGNRPNHESTVYTNFLILERFRLPDGSPLIDHDRPERSPLLQAGLMRSEANWEHPEVPPTRGRRGWRPIFRDQEDPRYQDAIEWIRSLYRPRPEYPIDYALPTPKMDSHADHEPVDR